MPGTKLVFASFLALAFAGALSLTALPASAQTATVLHSFGGYISDGFSPLSGLVEDANGNLYGTTQSGGASNLGMVFELKKTSTGYTYSEIYSFQLNGTDGFGPVGNVILDSQGSVYGTTASGGTKKAGTVFELSPLSNGGWSETILYNFGIANGNGPLAGLIFDQAGNLYGTAAWGGSSAASGGCPGYRAGCGIVFELVHRANGSWDEKILHNFESNGTDGTYVSQGLIFDSKGNLYGTTQEGGANNWGVAFELSPSGSEWNETILHTFNNIASDGGGPDGPLVFDSAGNLYGVTGKGGPDFVGSAYELSPASGGGWTESILYFFQENNVDGRYPAGNLVFNSAGDIYGLTGDGGSTNNGALFELVPSGSGWTESIVQSFDVTGFDPEYPNGGLLQDSAGNLYGTSVNGGRYGSNGAAWKITP